jgi:hypothetical protein
MLTIALYKLIKDFAKLIFNFLTKLVEFEPLNMVNLLLKYLKFSK